MIAMHPAMWKYMVESGFAEKYGLIKGKKVMKFNDLALALSEKEGISVYKSKKVINSMLDLITTALSKGDEVYLRRLGKIELREKSWGCKTGNLFRAKWAKQIRELGFWEKRSTRRGHSIVPHIQLSKMFKRKAIGG